MLQDKLRAEVRSVIGAHRMPSVADRSAMPYAAATVMEMQRRANILQSNVPRRAVVDTEIRVRLYLFA